MLNIPLLPCPCCGGPALYSHSCHETRMDGSVYCVICGLMVEEYHDTDEPGTAIIKWNARVYPFEIESYPI